jgi:hypothetical protein
MAGRLAPETVRPARPLLPTDLLALVASRGRANRNEAKPRERVGASESDTNLIETAVEQWLPFARGRSVWISARRQRLQGLVSARSRGTRQAWEIDCLIDTTPTVAASPGLLACAMAEAGRSGAEKLFLRLAEESEALTPARSAGFIPYATELLYVRPAALLASVGAPFRPFSQQDLYPAFRLYNQTVPEAVRRCEAATFSEWQAAQERRWLKSGIQIVSERDGRLTAWLRAAQLAQGISIDLTVDSGSFDLVEPLLAAAAASFAGPAPLHVLVGEFDAALAGRLEGLGFVLQERLVSLVHRTTRTVTVSKMLPAIAQTAVVT